MNTEVIGNFICCGKHMVIVELEHGVHVMPIDEWRRVYRKLHPKRWKKNRIEKKIFTKIS